MKAIRKTLEVPFTPIELSLQIESHEEAAALYTFFNAHAFYGTFGFSNSSAESVRLALGNVFYDGHHKRYEAIRSILR